LTRNICNVQVCDIFIDWSYPQEGKYLLAKTINEAMLRLACNGTTVAYIVLCVLNPRTRGHVLSRSSDGVSGESENICTNNALWTVQGCTIEHYSRVTNVG